MSPRTPKFVLALAAIVALAAAPRLRADGSPAIKRNVVLTQDTGVPGREGVMAWVELPIGAVEGKHTHPGDAFGFVLQGTILLEIEGNAPATLKAGDVFHVPQGKVHQAKNMGTDAVKLAVVFVAEKGKPLTTHMK